MSKYRIWASSLALSTVLAVIAPPSIASARSIKDDPSAHANALLEQFFDESLELSPMRQSRLGLKSNYDRWDDLSHEARSKRVELARRQLTMLHDQVDYEALDAQTKRSVDLFVLESEQTIEGFVYRDHEYLLEQMYGWQSRVPSFLINFHRIDTVEDAEAYIARMEGVRTLFDQVIARVDGQAKRGLLPPPFVFEHVLNDSRNVLAGAPFEDTEAESVIMADFRGKVAGLDADDATKQSLVERGESALLSFWGPAYRDLIARVERWKDVAPADDGVWRMEDGAAYYDYRLRTITTTDLAADEIHELGLREVERIHEEMRGIMAQVGFEGTLLEFFDFMREDSQFYLPDTEEGRAAYLAQATQIIDTMRERLPELFLRMPKADVVVKAVEPFRERSAGKAFYERPAPDGTRPGAYYANLYSMADMPTYQMEALAYHEGIPGHHMQIAIAQELGGLPRFRKYGGYTAYTEGWGLYAELVPKEIGFYEDPYSDFGRLAMELWRACRLVVDTGIHHRRWSREEAIEYLMENTPNPRGDVVKAIERYIVMPGQANAYKIGMIKIVELRARAAEALGEAFDLRAFHDVVLSSGPVPLSTLEEIVDQWIADQS